MQLDPRAVRQQVENLKLVHPDLLEDDEAWVATLESQTSFPDLITSIVRRIEDTKALVIGTKDRFEELRSRKDRFERRVESLRNLLFKLMEAAEIPGLELPEATLSIRKGQPQVIGEPDPLLLPPRFQIVRVTPNLTAIKEALKTGETVPGCSLSNAAPTISIRIK